MSPYAEAVAGGVRLKVKVVPGARRSEIAGLLGDRLRIRIAAPPEDGRANRALAQLLAARLGVRARDIDILSGHASSSKLVLVRGVTPETATRILG